MTQTTAAEWNAKTEQVRGQIAEQKYLQAGRELKREVSRMRLQDVADKVLGVEIARAEIGLESKKLALQGDKIGLQGSKDNLRYLTAKNTLQQRAWAVDLMSLEVNLAGSEAKLGELRNVAKTLSHQIKSYVPRDVFGGANGASKID
jgi:hypothetical protein